MNDVEKKRSFIIKFLYFAIIILIVYVAFKYVAGWIMPFLIGFGIAMIMKPLIRKLEKHISVSTKTISFAVILVCYSLLVLLLWLLISVLFSYIQKGIAYLPEFYQFTIKPAFNELNSALSNFVSRLSPELVEQLNLVTDSISNTVQSFITSISTNTINYVTNFGSKIPNFLVALVFTIMSSIFICMDYGRISKFIMRQMPKRASELLLDIKDYLIGTVFKYFKATMILMVITFIELSVGLMLLGTEHAILKAGLIALADALPVIGTGGVVIPWIIIELIKQNFTFAFGLTILYVIITIVRTIIEPRIVGKQLGLHPVVSLVAAYVGLKLYGVLGMIFLPIVMAIIIGLNREGKIHLYKLEPKASKDENKSDAEEKKKTKT